jgi:hypothetical protein
LLKRSIRGISHEKQAMTLNDQSASENAALLQIAPGLKHYGERLWGDDQAGCVSYPIEAHAQFAAIEDSSFWFRHRNAIIQTVVGHYPPSGPIIDVGGGNGSVALALKLSGLATIVVEPGPVAARTAHDRGLTVIRSPFNAEMFVAGSVPAIGLFDVIEHVPDDLQLLTACRTVLCEGGMVYVTVPALQWLWSSDDQFAGHFRRYSQRLLYQRLIAAGFDVLLLSAFFSLLVPPVALLRTLPSILGLRKLRGPKEAIQHHQANRPIGKMIERMLSFEKILLARQTTVPFGTSLIAVARRPMH